MSDLSNTPLSVYQDFIAIFQMIMMQSKRTDIEGKRINEGIEKLIPFEARDKFLWNQLERSSNAITSIKQLLLNPNNNSDLLINEIKSDCNSISGWLESIIQENIILKDAKGLNDEEINEYFKGLSEEEKKQIDLYNDLATPFYDFYSSFLNFVAPRVSKNKIGKETNEIPSNHLEMILKKLIEMKILSDSGVMSNKIDNIIHPKPALNLAIEIIAKHYNLAPQTLQKKVAGSWKIEPKSNAYTSPSANRLNDYKGFLIPLESWLKEPR